MQDILPYTQTHIPGTVKTWQLTRLWTHLSLTEWRCWWWSSGREEKAVQMMWPRSSAGKTFSRCSHIFGKCCIIRIWNINTGISLCWLLRFQCYWYNDFHKHLYFKQVFILGSKHSTHVVHDRLDLHPELFLLVSTSCSVMSQQFFKVLLWQYIQHHLESVLNWLLLWRQLFLLLRFNQFSPATIYYSLYFYMKSVTVFL